MDTDDHLDEIVDMPTLALIGENALHNIADQIRYIKEACEDNEEEAIGRARFALRAIACVLPPGQDDPVSVAFLTGFLGAPTMTFIQALTATGPWSGEMGMEKMKAYLMRCIAVGDHPKEVANETKIPQDEYNTIALLLDLEKHWHDTIGDRVFISVMSGEDLKAIRKIARCSKKEAKRWQKWAQTTAIDLGIERMLQ